ncbi:Phosphoprotein [Frankliniella fusca]|uniref:Phosphoprotein n=1 Tax=Frankliniella fusca TaxID=407009 RepID=A0AAE1HPS1_9NEOP|nr:Phosphoprotein [Frankliniella fusca]
MPVLQVHMNLVEWSTHLTNGFIAELVKPYISYTSTAPPPHHDGDDESYQDGPCSPPPFTTPSFSSHLNENIHETTLPWIHETRIKTEPCEMEEDSKVGILPKEKTSHCSTHREGSPIHDDSETLTYDSGISVRSSRMHKIRLTKDVPPAYAYWFRGVRCPICRYCFRGQSCVSQVVEHVSTEHKDESSPQVMESLRRDCTLEKVIGPGIRYCGCQSCLEAARLSGYTG